MPPADPALLDLVAFLADQRSERYRAVVVHGAPLVGKSAFARRLAEVTGGVYVDVLSRVASSPGLAASVDTLDAAFLKGLMLEAAPDSTPERQPGKPDLVVLDDFDFLVPIWGGTLARFLEMLRRVSATETPVIPVFFLQTHPELEEAPLLTAGGRSRILRFEELQAL